MITPGFADAPLYKVLSHTVQWFRRYVLYMYRRYVLYMYRRYVPDNGVTHGQTDRQANWQDGQPDSNIPPPPTTLWGGITGAKNKEKSPDLFLTQTAWQLFLEWLYRVYGIKTTKVTSDGRGQLTLRWFPLGPSRKRIHHLHQTETDQPS